MKKFFALFIICMLGVPFGARCDDADTAARAARNIATNAVPVTTPQSRLTATRNSQSVNTARQSQNQSARAGATTAPRIGVVATRAATTPAVVNRSATFARTATPARATASRAATNSRVAQSARTATNARGAVNAATRSRAATTTATELAAATDYKKCRDVFYNCMDEFCANKDAQLKRCACSSRLHEFDAVRAQLDKIEDEMLKFNERLLTVNMDAEDALAISQATEGETAFQVADKSESQKMLDEIADKLKMSTDETNFNNNLSAISLSLDVNAAFDNIDSMMGADTITKEGAELYNSALPTCREMVREVCDETGAQIAESGYQMVIEQDCNTVSNTYKTMQENALAQVRDSGALLDMSRLDIHQTRNSDDILTCKRKMLDALTDSAVCGADLSECLDMTGRYIDPSTGAAFLTSDLSKLNDLITRPENNQKWTSMPGNVSFVRYLNNKKLYLESAMENCQDISDSVWNQFMEDALAQIKLAQEKKLENVRQSCTTLTSQCLTTTFKSISDFDARALSVFGVSADMTTNAMCANVKSACVALLDASGGGADWGTGIANIATDKTYDTIMSTCREVGKACITDSCRGTTSNFALCTNINSSINRQVLVNRENCWDQVVKCVASAGESELQKILSRHYPNGDADLYAELYESGVNYGVGVNDENGNPIHLYDICQQDVSCGASGQVSCAACKIAEHIWGNCSAQPQHTDSADVLDSRIIMPKSDKETLMSWFAVYTNTAVSGAPVSNAQSCADMLSKSTGDGRICPYSDIINIYDDHTNCCDTGSVSGDNCFIGAVPNQTSQVATFNDNGSGNYYMTGENNLYCAGGAISLSDDGKVLCNGVWAIENDNKYYPPEQVNYNDVGIFYYNDSRTSVPFSKPSVGRWSDNWLHGATPIEHWFIKFK